MVSRRGIAAASIVCGALAATLGSLDAQDDLLITELLAQNTDSLADEDREFSDWFEIHNPGSSPVDLAGYHLTDDAMDLEKWTFPAVTIQPGGFLVVFASGKDRRDPAAPLHTNFRLERSGETLALLTPDGANVVSGYAPFPPQVADASYGAAVDFEDMVLIDATSPLRALVPTDDSLGTGWTAPGFDDTSWIAGAPAVGFGGRAADVDQIRTDVEALMVGINASVYVRIPFAVDDPSRLDLLTLAMRYDDGFAAYLNGELVLAVNVDGDLTWNAEADLTHSASARQEFDLGAHRGLIVPGRNVLAIHGLNTSVTNSDVFLLPELVATDLIAVRPDDLRYFPAPTPGSPNGRGFSRVAPPPAFSHDDGVFTEAQTVTLSTEVEGGVIRYTLDGREPSPASTEYTAPIVVNAAVLLTARVFHPDMLPGIPASRTLVMIDPSLQTFDSNLPLAIALTFGTQIGSNCDGPYTPGHFVIIEPGEDGRARIIDEPSFTHIVGFRRRGSSTCGRAKFSFNVETRNSEGEEDDTRIFDWPRHADYAMYGPENFDRALMRNPFVYELSRAVGQYAVRTRFVECFLHMGQGPVRSANYHGLYVFMERNKRGEGRVDIDRVTPQDNAEPPVSGGYLMKVDRDDGALVVTLGGQAVVMVQPGTLTPDQRVWLTRWMDQMRVSLNPNTVLERDGEYVDVRSWIDHHILNMYPMNVDAFRLSGYFFKPRSGPLRMGPIWDYDRTMGSTDGRDANPIDWNGGGTQFFTFGWYNVLFGGLPPTGRSAWEREYIERWRELRSGPMSSASIEGIIDRMADEIREAADRNFARWSGVRPRPSPAPLDGTFQGEVNHLKNWLRRRAEWIDGHFVPVPTFAPASSVVARGALVELRGSPGARVIYTLDGTDPRGLDDRPSPSAFEYREPITIAEPTRIRARTVAGAALWSGLVEGVYILSMPRLVVTEVHYNPADPTPEEDPLDAFNGTDMEFVEITNIDSEPADLFGVAFNRTTFVFEFDGDSDIHEIAPGETIVVVENRDAFAARYGFDNLWVAGQFRSGSLNNSGETVGILAATGAPIVEFRYDDAWYPQTDGVGFSLVNVDPFDPSADLDAPQAWRPSAALHGTPGFVDAAPNGGLRLPGDLTADGLLDVADAVGILRYLFAGVAIALPCGDGATRANLALLDVDGDGVLLATDAIFTFEFLFRAGPPPAAGTRCVRVDACSDACAG